MEGYRRVGGVEEFDEGKIRVFIVAGGTRVAVVRWRDRFYAFADECTHQGVTLRTAELTPDDELVCPVHYAVYRLATGEVVDGPSAIDDLPVFDVRVAGDDVFLGETASRPALADVSGQRHG